MNKLLISALCVALVGCAKTHPHLASIFKSDRQLCTDAALEARDNAIAMGIGPERLQWLYGIKPFSNVAHVSLVIDGTTVVDNGGLGRNVWGYSICPGNVCSLDEATRGYDRFYLESASLTLRQEF